MPFTHIFLCFTFYAFAGWCCEVVYAALATGKFVNRGFLNGPVCPVYGFGMLLVLAALTALSDNLLTLFAGSFVLTSAIEFLTGFLLEKVFHEKWWDYSDEHFNIKGYICLRFSLMWGFACTFVVRCVHPVVDGVINAMPNVIAVTLTAVISLLFVCDITVTLITILKLKKRIRLIEAITAEMKAVSDKIGGGLYEGTVIGEKKLGEAKEKYGRSTDKLRAELDRAKKTLEKLKNEKFFGYKRIAKAFPKLNEKYSLAEKKEMLIDKIKKAAKKN